MPARTVVVRHLVIASAITALASASAHAAVTLPHVIGSGMVLQRDRAIPIWGHADSGERITVSIAGQKQSTVAKPDGTWRVNLGKLSAGGPHQLVVEGTNKITLDDVLIGDVWICGGQSNMDRNLKWAIGADAVASMAGSPKLRLFRVDHVASTTPVADVEATWNQDEAEAAGLFSAVGYYFGKELHSELGVPIGLIQSTWGGTPAEAWMSEAALRDDPKLQETRDRIAQTAKRAPADQARWDVISDKYKADLKAWEQQSKADKADAASKPKVPAKPASITPQKQPIQLYNAMIAPLAPYAVKGTVWYQGEANALFGREYRALLPAVIADWRKTFETPAMPFGIVQLANLKPSAREPQGELAWAELREAQLMTSQRDPNAGLVVTIDVGNPDDIHPLDKKSVGHRLALWAKAQVYGQAVEYSGPIFKTMRMEGATAHLSFEHSDGLATREGAEVSGFEIAGEDRVFAPAAAHIAGNEIAVSSPSVAHPVAVRYAWAKNPAATLINGAGLPASPFRTDDWPLPVVSGAAAPDVP